MESAVLGFQKVLDLETFNERLAGPCWGDHDRDHAFHHIIAVNCCYSQLYLICAWMNHALHFLRDAVDVALDCLERVVLLLHFLVIPMIDDMSERNQAEMLFGVV